MAQLVEQLLTGIGFGKQRQALLYEFERVGFRLLPRRLFVFPLGFGSCGGVRNTAVTHRWSSTRTRMGDPTIAGLRIPQASGGFGRGLGEF